MRHLPIGFACVLALACQRSVDVRGFYVAGQGTAVLAPCGDSSVVWSAPDSSLRARYEQAAARPSELLFVRVRGFSADSAGSIYGRLGGAKARFVVREVIEIRSRKAGDCLGPVPFETLARRLHLTR